MKPATDDEGVTERWPWRNLLLVEMPGGARAVLELAVAPADPRGSDEPQPSYRVSLSGGGVVETWRIPDPDPAPGIARGTVPTSWDAPCGGGWYVLYGGGHSARLESPSAFTRTMRASIGDVRDAALRPEDVAILETVFRIEIPPNAPSNDLYTPRTSAGLLLLDRPQRNQGPRYVLSPSPRPPGDLAPWRALTEIPMSLSPYVFIPVPSG